MRALAFLLLLMLLVACESKSSQKVKQRPSSPPDSTGHVTNANILAEPNVRHLQKLIEDRQWEQVDSELTTWLSSLPERFDLLFLLARSKWEQGEKQQAIDLLTGIPKDDPEAGLAAIGQTADWCLEDGQLELAASNYRLVLQQAPKLSNAIRNLAKIENALGHRQEAWYLVQQLVEIGDVTEKELLSLTTMAVPFHDSHVQDKHSEAKVSLANAKLLMVQEKFDILRPLLPKIASDYPHSASALAFIGAAYDAMQADAELYNWLKTSQFSLTTQADYWQALTGFFLRKGESKPAVRAAMELVSLDPTNRLGYLRLAQALSMAGRLQEARLASERQQLLQEAWKIAIDIGNSRGDREENLKRLITLLDQLHRPWEKVAWKFIEASEAGTIQREMPGLITERRQLSTTANDTASPNFHCCGLHPDDWPLPDLQTLASTRIDRTLSQPKNPGQRILLRDVSPRLNLNFSLNVRDPSEPGHFYMYEVAGSGVSVIDFDLDGWPDLFFPQAGSRSDEQTKYSDTLFRNLHGTQYVNVSVASGVTEYQQHGQGATTADINQDGLPDILVANVGTNQIWINQGDGTFLRKSLSSASDWTMSIACGDLNGDHLPEVIEVNYANDPKILTTPCWGGRIQCVPANFKPALDQLFTMTEAGEFVTWPEKSGFDRVASYGFSSIITQMDNRLGNEMLIVNDTKQNHYWTGEMTENGFRLNNQAVLRGCATGANGAEQGCMGIASGDFDRNGLIDFMVTNYWNEPSNLFLQLNSGFFTDQAAHYGLVESSLKTVGFGTQSVDFDRDGWLDIAVLNGHVFDPVSNGTPEVPFAMKPQLYHQLAGKFEEQSSSVESDYWSQTRIGRALATLDYNRDGKPDLIATHIDSPASLLENNTETQHFMRFQLIGVDSERDAIGAMITLRSGTEKWTGWVTAGDGFACCNEAIVDFGVADSKAIDRIDVSWPSGKETTLTDLSVDQTYILVENESGAFPLLMTSQ